MSRYAPRIRSTVARFVLAVCVALASARSSRAAVDCTTSNCTVDFLFVIDNSVSMGMHQTALAQATEEMAAQLASDSIDWRIAVTYTDLRSGDVAGQGTTCAGAFGAGSHVLCPFTRDMHVFRDGSAGCAYANPGTCGGGAERGFSAARAALTRLHTGTGCEAVPGGECNLRPDANLVLIFVSDTGEQTNSGPLSGDDNSVASWAEYFASQGVQVVHGIDCPFDPTPDNPAPCGDGNVAAENYERYRELIRTSLGVEASILDSDFGDTIRVIINAPQNTGTTTTTVAPSSTTTTSTSTTTTTTPGGSVTTSTTTPVGSATTTTTAVGSATTSTTTTPVGNATTTTSPVGTPTTTTTTGPVGSTTTTTMTQPSGSTTTSTLPYTDTACTPGADVACDDGDPCTEDTCSGGGRCQHAAVKGFDAITCRLPPAACSELPERMLRRLRGAHRLIEQAATASSTKKTNRLVAQVARIIRAASVKANRRVRKGKLSGACAAQLRRVLLETQSRIKR